jgi:flagellar biosynthetic protein FlhB
VSDERQHKPSTKRITDARLKGKVLRSGDVRDVMQFGAVLIAIAWFGRPLVEGLADALKAGILAMGSSGHRTISEAELSGLTLQTGKLLLVLVGPIALASIIAGFFAILTVGGWNVSTQPLGLDFSRLSPAAGFARLKPSKAGLDLVRILLALTGFVWIAWGTVHAMVEDTLAFGRIMPTQAAALGWNVAEGYLRRAWVVMAILAGVDYGVQRFRYMQGLKMTRQEVKEESRMQEGAPEIKARVRKAQRQLLRKRMLANVKAATVVVTNPTHYAVALEYKRDQMFAPKVVAKGVDFMAERIKKTAREHNVPVVENVALARALYANAEVGDTIPGDLFEAVAEVLAYLIKLKQLVF